MFLKLVALLVVSQSIKMFTIKLLRVCYHEQYLKKNSITSQKNYHNTKPTIF
jgi:hypothetical protein